VKQEASEIVMERFDKYYGGIPKIRQVIIKPFGQLRTAWAGLLRGELDMVTNVPPDAVQFIRNDEVDVFSFSYRYQYLVAFNSRRAPFDSAAVRRALNYAIDRPALVKNVLQDRGAPSTGPLWPKHWAYDTSVAPFGFDAGLATSLLNAAGVPPDTKRGGRPNSRIRFTCLIPARFTQLERVGLHVQKQLYNIGVDMQFEVVPAEEFDSRVRDGRFEAMMIDMLSGPSLGRAYNFWGSSRNVKGFNVFGYENAEAERLFGILRTSTNEAAVRSATSNLQRVLLDDPPALFIAWQERSRAVRRDFQVVQEPDRDPVTTIWRWSAAVRPADRNPS
jgi:peptide/nickel transport system substrate-binding protein